MAPSTTCCLHDTDPGVIDMNRLLNDTPEITRSDVADAIVRARRERSEFIAAALRGLAQRLRLPRKAPVPGPAVHC
jgi:hypothetical protein